jgi:Flp pilus assembly protein TadG
MLRKLLRGREKGQSLVEFALASIVFFIMVFGLIDVGRAVWNYNTLSQATREGARYAIVHGSRSADPATADDPQDIVDQVEKFAGGLNLDDLTVTATWPDDSNNPGREVTIESTYSYTPMFGMFGIPSFDMSSSSTMEIRY